MALPKNNQPFVEQAIAAHQQHLHAEDLKIADYIERFPQRSIEEARSFVERFLQSTRHTRYHFILRQWQRILDTRTPESIAAMFRASAPKTEELRTSAPFCGASLQTL